MHKEKPVLPNASALELLPQVPQWGRVSTFINHEWRHAKGLIFCQAFPGKNITLWKLELSTFCQNYLPCWVEADPPDHQLFVLTSTRQEVSPRRKGDTVDRSLLGNTLNVKYIIISVNHPHLVSREGVESAGLQQIINLHLKKTLE